MVADYAPKSFGKIIPKPISIKATAAAARNGSIYSTDSKAEAEAKATAARELTKGYKVKQYEVLYPVVPINDFEGAYIALENTGQFLVGGRGPDAPVIDRYMIKTNTIVILCYGKNDTLQKPYWYKV